MNTKTAVIVLVIIGIVLGSYYVFRSPQYSQTPVTSSATTTSATTTAAAIVTIHNFAFNPATTTISKGETVEWTNQDPVAHQIAGGELNGPVMSKGQTYSFTFTTAGTFNYHCAIHPSMTGTVVVK